MADRTRTITLRINDQFSRELKEFVRQMDAAERSTEGLTKAASGSGRWGGFKQLNQDLFYVTQNAKLMYDTFSQVFRQANEWAQIGIGAERSKIALTGLAGSAESAAQWIEAVNAGAHGALTEGEAAANAYRLMRFGLADTAEEAQKFIDTVSKVALVNPQLGGTEEAINQIQLTLSNMSFMRLDQLGISAGVVRRRMQELKDEFAGLETEDAFRMAVMEQLNEQADLLGDNIVEMDDAMQRFNARWRNFKEDAGLRIAEGFEAIAETAEGLEATLERLGRKEFIVRFGVEFFREMGAPKWMQDFYRVATTMGQSGGLYTGAMMGAAIAPQVQWVMGGLQSLGLVGPPDINQTITTVQHPSWMNQAGVKDSRYWWQPPGLGQGVYGRGKGPGFQTISFDAMIRAGYSSEDIANWERLIQGQAGIGIDYPWARIAGPENFRGMRAAGYTSPEVQSWQQQYMDALFTAYIGADQPPPGTLRRLQAQNVAQDRFQGNRDFMQALIPTLFGGGGTLGLNYRVGQMGQFGMQGLQDQIPNLLKIRDTIGEIAGRWGDVARAAFDAITPAERYASLTEKFGLDPHTFDLDVYDRMKDAMSEAEVPAAAMADAMRRFEHETGIANAQSEIFDVQMGELAERLKIGQLTAQEYVNAVSRLSSMDMSGIQSMMGPLAEMDMNTYLTVLDRISNLSPDLLVKANNLPSIMQGAVSNIQDALFGVQGGGQVDALSQRGSPLEPMLNDVQEITDRFATVDEDWGGPVIRFGNIATGEFTAMKLDADVQIEAISQTLDSLTAKDYTVRIKVWPEFAEGANKAAMAFVSGGYGEVSTADIVYNTVTSEASRRNNPNMSGGAQVP